MAPPTESTILSTFLLQPASLPTIMTLKSFTDLFPRPQQSSPQIKKLYRDLQHQRARVLDKIASNIDKEVQRGMEQRRQVIRQRRRDQMEEQDDEAYVENALFGPTSNLPVRKLHTLDSIIPGMQAAAEELEEEVRRLEEEAEGMVEEMTGTVGGLSDLRYGRFANEQLRKQVLSELKKVEKACDGK